MEKETVIFFECDFIDGIDAGIKIEKVWINGAQVEISEPFLILDNGKSFCAVEITKPQPPQ